MRTGAIANLRIFRALFSKRIARAVRFLKEEGYLSKGHDDIEAPEAALLFYALASTGHNRQLGCALDNFGTFYANNSKYSKLFNSPWEYWPINTFLTILLSNEKLLEEVKEIRISKRTGYMTVVYKDGTEDEFRRSTEDHPVRDHDGEPFDPDLADDQLVVKSLFLDMYFRAIQGLPDKRRK